MNISLISMSFQTKVRTISKSALLLFRGAACPCIICMLSQILEYGYKRRRTLEICVTEQYNVVPISVHCMCFLSIVVCIMTELCNSTRVNIGDNILYKGRRGELSWEVMLGLQILADPHKSPQIR